MSVPIWPLGIWSLQLLPAGIILGFGSWRYLNREWIQANDTTTLLLCAMSVLWILIVGATLTFPRGRRWILFRRKEWLLSVASFAVSLVLVDVAASSFGLVPTIEAQRARSVGYSYGLYTNNRLIAKDIVVDDNNVIRINDRGFRGDEVESFKGPVSRILFLGGSQVFDADGGNWPEMVGSELSLEGRAVEIVNAGVPGHTTFDSLGKLVSDAWTLEPDVIVLCQAWNDVKYFAWIGPDSPYRGLAPTEPLILSPDWRIYPSGIDRILTVSAIYRQFHWGIGEWLYSEEGRARRATDVEDHREESLRDWGPQQYRLNLKAIATLAESIGAELVLCKQARLAVREGTGATQAFARDYALRNTGLFGHELIQAFETTYEVIDEIADRYDSQVLDLNAALSGREEYFYDGIHFSRMGSEAASKMTAGLLNSLLDSFADDGRP